jgi:hypothetical protein
MKVFPALVPNGVALGPAVELFAVGGELAVWSPRYDYETFEPIEPKTLFITSEAVWMAGSAAFSKNVEAAAVKLGFARILASKP